MTWSEVGAAAGAKQFTNGMTDPSASNSGFSTVVAVATALVGSGSALTVEQAASTAPGLTDFVAGQTLAAGSSGFLQDAYVRRATGADPGPAVDGLVNYESVLLALNASGTQPEPLELIYPADGVVTAEYPFTVLSAASAQARDDHRRLTEYLRTPDVQRSLMDTTFRRPAVPGVALDPIFGTATLVELPFPAQADVVDTPDIGAFRSLVAARPASLRGLPVFAVLFGESDNAEMEEVATLTGGRPFDARSAPLAEVFKEIRGYV